MAFNLASLNRGVNIRPPRVIIYGSGGIGKTTLALGAPNPVLIPIEEGADIFDVPKFPQIASEENFLEALGSLITEDHNFQSVVIDTADWLEGLIWSATAAEHGKEGIEGWDFGKGYTFALSHWRQILEGLDVLRNEKGMMPIILAHSQIKRFDDPATASYDRFQLDLHKSAAALLNEWCDIMGFMTYRITIEKKDVGFKKEIVRGKSGGDRVLHLEERPGFISKNRYGMQESIPITKAGGWSIFQAELERALTPLPPVTEEVKNKSRKKEEAVE